MKEREDTQDFDIWAAEWVVAPFVSLGLEEEKGRVGRGEEERRREKELICYLS